MKKILTTAMVLGSLMNVANAMEMNRITSPLYMPKAGDTLVDSKVGFYEEDFNYDRYNNTADDYTNDSTRWTIREDLTYGIRDDWSFDFGFVFDFDQERERDFTTNTSDREYEDDADFHSTYFGLTKRFMDDSFKLDGLAKIYMQENANTHTSSNATPGIEFRNESLELAARAGFDIGDDLYDTAVTFGVKFIAEETSADSTSSTTTETEVDKQLDWYIKWENQFNPIVGFDFGIDIEYRMVDEFQTVSKTNGLTNVGVSSFVLRDHGVWTLFADANYLITDKVSVGAYVEFKDYEDASLYRLDVNANPLTSPYSSDKDRESTEFGIQTLVQF